MFGGLDDHATLLLVLALLYFAEAVVWMPTGAVLLVWRPLAKNAAIRWNGWLGHERGRFGLIGLWPGSFAWLAEPWPLRFSPEGVAATDPPVTWDWDALAHIQSSDCELRIGDRLLARTASPGLAEFLGRLLRQAAEIEAPSRESWLLQQLAESLSLTKAQARIRLLKESLRTPIRFSIALAATAFLLGPLSIWVLPYIAYSIWTGWGVSALFLLLWLGSLASYYRAACELQVVTSGYSTRRPDFWPLLCSPAAALWIPDRLTRDCLADLHPLAVAGAALSPSEFLAFARWMRRQSELIQQVSNVDRNSASTNKSPGSPETDWFCKRLWERWVEIAHAVGVSAEKLTDPPEREPAATHYCRRCERQYLWDSGGCAPCEHRPLSPFETHATGR